MRNATGGTNLSACVPCTPGYYCETAGIGTPTGPCSGGYYIYYRCWLPIVSSDLLLYCPGGQTTPFPGSYLCPFRQHCPPGSEHWVRCPGGTYTGGNGHSVCDPCPKGSFCEYDEPCSETNATIPRPCLEGFYCPAGTAHADEHPCLPG
eukprot:gene56820-biopygen110416